ncbi:MAG: molybdopterin molybdotransferase MoeA [bacterium]|nr:molybdopterin molybdotransferase MoeA [bacterium]
MMIAYRQALDLILAATERLPQEHLPLTSAQHRIVAEALVAPYDSPPFDQSLMDGFAVRSAATRSATPEAPVRLPIGRTLTAGDALHQSVAPGQAIRIMTGAPMPAGVNAIIKVEDSETEDGELVIRYPIAQGMYVQRRGAEIRRRTVVLRQGERLTPQGIGTALSLGIDMAAVVKCPRVALVAPGDELLPPGAPLEPGKKWCSNLYALALRARDVGAIPINLGIVPDTLAALTEQLERGLEADIIIILGGSGRGDHDFAIQAMRAVGAELLFRGVATSPGRTITVSRHQHRLIFALPGSPWAAFVGFEVFVWPALRAMLGQRSKLPLKQTARLTSAVQVQRGVTHFIPVRLQADVDGLRATPLTTFIALAQVDTPHLGFIVVSPHRCVLASATQVRVQPLIS